jgi:hypothetical protein
MADNPNVADTNPTAPWWIKEVRQYGIAALVMAICMVAVNKLYEDWKIERAMKDAKVTEITEKVSTVVDRNSTIINEFKISVDRNTDATRQLETAVKSAR